MTIILNAEPLPDIVAPDPTGDLAERIALTPHTRMRLECFITLANVNGDREQFTRYVADCGRGGQSLAYWQWASLLDMYDAANEHATRMDARYAGAP